EKKQYEMSSNGFNKTILNSKSFYQFAGVQDLTNGGDTQKLAFTFYDAYRDEYSYIVRTGDNAFNELRDFTQSRFYNWEGFTNEQKRQVTHIAEADRARRRYDRFFSMDGGGKGLSVDASGNVIERGTAGFSGLK